jgi:hypothetical protein
VQLDAQHHKTPCAQHMKTAKGALLQKAVTIADCRCAL